MTKPKFTRGTCVVAFKKTRRMPEREVVVDGLLYGPFIIHRRDALHDGGEFNEKDGYQITHASTGAYIFPPFDWTRRGIRLSYAAARKAVVKLEEAGGWDRSYKDMKADRDWLARTGTLRIELAEDPDINGGQR